MRWAFWSLINGPFSSPLLGYRRVEWKHLLLIRLEVVTAPAPADGSKHGVNSSSSSSSSSVPLTRSLQETNESRSSTSSTGSSTRSGWACGGGGLLDNDWLRPAQLRPNPSKARWLRNLSLRLCLGDSVNHRLSCWFFFSASKNPHSAFAFAFASAASVPWIQLHSTPTQNQPRVNYGRIWTRLTHLQLINYGWW